MVGLPQRTPAGCASSCSRAAGPTAVHTTALGLARGVQRHREVRCHGTIPGSSNVYNGITSWTNSTASRQVSPEPAKDAAENSKSQQESNGSCSGALQKADFPKFVQFFRQASPYIAGHRARTFVIVVPGNVSCASASAVHACCP